MLMQADTGIDWDSIVAGHDGDSLTTAEIYNLCLRASELCDHECDQVLRATIDTEQLDAPGDRCLPVPSRGGSYLRRVRAQLARWPVRQVLSIGVAPAEAFPWTFQAVPDGHWGIRNDAGGTLGGGGASMIEFEAGWVDWVYGREGYIVQVQYRNGWCNAVLTAPVGAAPVTTLSLDDITGALDEPLTIYEGDKTETVTVTAATPASGTAITGPGTVTLAAACQYEHASGVIVSAFPSTIQQAAIYFGADIALSRGATTIGLKPMGGADDISHQKSVDFAVEAAALLWRFHRVV